MAGISSRAITPGSPENHKQFNGIEHTTDLDLNQYDAFFRTMDPQIGRWWQIDPNPNVSISPFVAMDNNPIFNIDPLGDTIIISQAIKNNSAALAAVNLFKKSDTFQKLYGQYDTGGEGSFFGGEGGSQSGSNFVFDVISDPKLGGRTTVEVQDADGNWQKVNDGAKFDPSSMSSDSKTKITVAVDVNTHKTPEGYANTFNHEATVHGAPYLKTLNVLREQGPQAFSRENSLSQSFSFGEQGKGLSSRGYNISNVQHGRVAAGDNLEYNAIRKELRQQMSPTQQKNYDKVVHNNLNMYNSALPAYKFFAPR